MRQTVFIGIILVLTGILPNNGKAFPVYKYWGALGPETSIQGNFVNQVNLGDLDFGGGLVLPFTIDYSSKLRDVSPYFGPGWGSALLDCSAVEQSPSKIAVSMLGGKTLYFYKDKGAENIYHHSGGRWKGEKKGSLFRISLPEGESMEFINGRISQIKTGDGRVIEWRRNGTLVYEIGERGKGALLKLNHAAGGLKSLEVAGQQYVFTKDIVSQGVQKILWPNGQESIFKRATDDKGQPFMEWQHPNGKPHRASWDLVTGRIKTLDDWNYTVEMITKKVNGKYIEDVRRWPKLRRENSKNKAKQFYWYDNQAGITTRLGLDGRMIKEYEFLTKGPLFRKIRKIEETIGGKTYVIERYAYNENGVLIKKILLDPRSGMAITESFNEAGQPLQTLVNGVVAEAFTYNDQGGLVDRKATAVMVSRGGRGMAAGALLSVLENKTSKAGLKNE